MADDLTPLRSRLLRCGGTVLDVATAGAPLRVHLCGSPRIAQTSFKGRTPHEALSKRVRNKDCTEQLPNHRHRNLKAFEEHSQTHVSPCSNTEQYLYDFLG